MSLHTRGMQQHCPSKNTTSCICGFTTVSSQTAPEELAGPVHLDVDHIVNELQLGKLYGLLEKDHGDQSLRHDRGDDDDLHVRTFTTAQQGHRPPSQRTGESQWFSEQTGPWGSPLRKDRNVDDHQSSQRAAAWENTGVSSAPARENLYDCTTGTSESL